MITPSVVSGKSSLHTRFSTTSMTSALPSVSSPSASAMAILLICRVIFIPVQTADCCGRCRYWCLSALEDCVVVGLFLCLLCCLVCVTLTSVHILPASTMCRGFHLHHHLCGFLHVLAPVRHWFVCPCDKQSNKHSRSTITATASTAMRFSFLSEFASVSY